MVTINIRFNRGRVSIANDATEKHVLKRDVEGKIQSNIPVHLKGKVSALVNELFGGEYYLPEIDFAQPLHGLILKSDVLPEDQTDVFKILNGVPRLTKNQLLQR